MYRDHSNLATSFQLACVATLILEAIGLRITGAFFFDWRLGVLCLLFGWLPIALIAFRRPDKPTKLDSAVMFFGFPLLFGAAAGFDRWYHFAK